MRSPASFGGQLPTVEDSSVASGSQESRQGSQRSLSNMPGGSISSQRPQMKRSPYLSVMAGSTKESEDLMAKLSRPAAPSAVEGGRGGLKRTSGGGTHGGTQIGAGPSVPSTEFFSLQRPSSGAANPLISAALLAQQGSHTVTPVSSAGTNHGDGDGRSQDESSGGDNSNEALEEGAALLHQPPHPHQQRPMPSLRSALKMSSRADVQATTDAMPNEMRKNTSVTFSNTTKEASARGMVAAEMAAQAAPQGNAKFSFSRGQMQSLRQFNPPPQPPRVNYTAAMMMKKSQSIAAPQFMLAHQNSVNSRSSTNRSSEATSNDSFPSSGTGDEGEGEGGNASFPIYFAKLPGEGVAPPQGSVTPSPPPSAASNPPGSPQPPKHQRQRSQSTNTLQYCYQSNTATMDPAQKLLHAVGMAGGVAGTGAPISRPSMNGLNLTFRDMLDEGDGAEGDLNLRQRNQQWKDFRSFSSKFASDNPMMAAAMDVDAGAPPTKEGGSVGSTSTTQMSSMALSGSKRTLTPSSLTSASTAASSRNAGGDRGFPPAGGAGLPQVAGSHRATVSVNDLAMLRRAASRMKMTPVGGMQSMGQRIPSTKRVGETLGGDLLSRISSEGANSSSTSLEPKGAVPETVDALTPLAQMMQRSSLSRGNLRSSRGNLQGSNSNLSVGGGSRQNLGGFASPEQKDLFMQKFNLALSGSGARLGDAGADPSQPQNTFGLTASGRMPRRVRTVGAGLGGAGLAYGRGNMTMDYRSGCRVSKFDLGTLRKESSRLSEISSASSGGGRNEEWDLS